MRSTRIMYGLKQKGQKINISQPGKLPKRKNSKELLQFICEIIAHSR